LELKKRKTLNIWSLGGWEDNSAAEEMNEVKTEALLSRE